MNGGLVSLMSYLIHAGDEKSRNKEYDRRQKALEEKSDRMAVQRDALMQERHDEDRRLDTMGKIASEYRQQENASALAKQKAAAEIETSREVARTIKRNATTPFPEWTPEDQGLVLAAANNDVTKAYGWIEDVQKGATGQKTVADIATHLATSAEQKNKLSVAEATAPNVARNAVMKQTSDYLESRGGGIPLATQLNQENRVLIRPDASVTVTPNAFKPLSEKEKETAALKDLTADSKNSLGALVAGQTDSIYKNPRVPEGLTATGEEIRPAITKWGAPAQEPVPPGGRVSFAMPTGSAPSWPPQTQATVEDLKKLEEEELKKKIARVALQHQLQTTVVPAGQSNWAQ